MGVETAAAVGLVGAGVQAYGQYRSSQAQAKAARQQSLLKGIQAQEMLERMAIQENRLHLQGEEFKSKQINEFASNGIELGQGNTLLALEDANMKITQGIDDMKRDTLFKVNQLRMGAGFDTKQASETETAGAILAGASLLEGAGDYYKNTK